MAKEKSYKGLLIRTIIAIIFVGLLLSTYFVRYEIENFLNALFYPEISNDVTNSELKMHFINVGNADAIAIELPNGEHMLIDSGDNTNASRDALITYLNNNFFENGEERVFDYFILTHSDADHVGGAARVFETYEIEKCFRPNQYTKDEATELNITNEDNIATTKVFESFVEALNKEVGCEVEFFDADSDMTFSNFDINFIAPLGTTYSVENNYSPVIILTYAGVKTMFTGDAEHDVEEEILALYDDLTGEYAYSTLDIDILKVGHHGSDTSSTEEFIRATTPKYAVICTDGEEYDHPSETVLNRLQNFGVNNIYRTDINGNILIGVNADATIAASLGVYTRGFKIEWYSLVILVGSVGLIIIFTVGTKRKKKKAK